MALRFLLGGSAMRRSRSILTMVLACVALHAPAFADPFVPQDPTLVVLEVPSDPLLKRVAALEGELQSQGDDSYRVYELAESYIELGRRTTEPRYFGRAEALLLQHLTAPSAPAGLRLQLADILQYRHEYAPAVAQIDQALAQQPSNARAHLMRAAIRQAAGAFADARADCGQVLASGDTFAGSVCMGQVMGMTGQIERARTLLTNLIERLPALPARYSGWALTALADLEERSGNLAAAETNLRRAVTGNPYDYYARLTLADLLLGQRRTNEVSVLLRDMPQSESTLLRLAESRAISGTVASSSELAALKDRFDSARARGERIHARDLARFNLRLLANPAAALQAARSNWAQQHEPIDARLLIECAQAAGDSSAIAEVSDWQRRTHYQDVKLAALLSPRANDF
jgi:tetratricopeptide (TPR) repeat protein